jgi:TolB-like protein/Tfp pilus assembly protein PilF
VLPFTNESGNTGVEYLSDGITESLINSLSQLPNLSVKARSTVFHYKGKDVTAQQVGSELSVQAVLNGRFVQRGDQLTLSLELVDARTGNQIWGEQYNRKTADLVSLQSEIARDVSNKLRVKLSGADEQKLAKNYTVNPEAYQLYLKGQFYWNKRTEETVKKGIECFKQAIEIDPNYALAYAGLADSYSLLGLSEYSGLPPTEAFPKAKQASVKALEIDNTLAEAHVSLAFAKMYFDWDFPGAESEYQKAIELNSSYATAHHFRALNLMAMGQADLAIAEMKKAQALEPLSLIINTNLGWMLYFARRYDQAIEQYQKTLEMDKNFYPARFRLGQAYLQTGSIEEAVKEFEQAVTLSERKARPLALLGHAYGLLGNRTAAERMLHELNELSKKRYVSSLEIARIYVALGGKDHAFDSFNKAIDEREGWLIWLKLEPSFDSLRSDTRYTELLRRMGLPQ